MDKLVPPSSRELSHQDYEALRQQLLPHARSHVQPRDLDDVIQETILRLTRRLADFDPNRGTYEQYAYGILWKCIGEYIRGRRRAHEVTTDEFDGVISALDGRRSVTKDDLDAELVEE